MEFSEEDFLGLFNRLFERLQQAGLVSGSNTHLHAVYVAKGGQYVETQMNYPQPLPKGGEKGDSFNDDTPLSSLFREGYYEKLKMMIDSWRRYMSDDVAGKDALELSHFEFDKDQIYSNRVYRDLCELDAQGALRVSLSQLARYLAGHSNLSRSYASLYQQLKNYRREWQ